MADQIVPQLDGQAAEPRRRFELHPIAVLAGFHWRVDLSCTRQILGRFANIMGTRR